MTEEYPSFRKIPHYDAYTGRANACKELEGKVATLLFDGVDPVLEVDFPTEARYFRLGVFGDCCSYSYWHEAANPEAVRVARIISIEDVPVPEHDGEDVEAQEQEDVKSYCVRIKTEKGICDLIFRNESNGYYGGDWYIEEWYTHLENEMLMEDGLLWRKS